MVDNFKNTLGRRKSAELKTTNSLNINGKPVNQEERRSSFPYLKKPGNKWDKIIKRNQSEPVLSQFKKVEELKFELKTTNLLNNNGKPVNQEEERSSFPDMETPGNNQSEPVLSQYKKVVELKLGDRLDESVKNNLKLLEGLARCLDKEHPYGRMKYWKHLAEHFGVEERTYKGFNCLPGNSPTEILFDHLKTRKPTEFTIEKLKESLNSIDRNDVIQDVFKKHQDLDSELTDKTTVGSLFDSHPMIIGEIAVLLDVTEPGKKNWRQLADRFGVPKSESQNFAESILGNPTEKLLEYIIKCLNPEMTVGYLQSILKDLQMEEASDVLANSKKVTKNTLVKDIWDQDDDAVDNLCIHLNQMYNSRIRGWRRLGHKLKIEIDVLKEFSPNEGEVISPTEALLNHLGGAKVRLTMKDLIWALASIDRKDALAVVKDYFPGGVVDIFLERKRASPLETEV